MNDIIFFPVSRKLVWYQLQGYLVISWELLTASRRFDQLSYIKYQGDCLHLINSLIALIALLSTPSRFLEWKVIETYTNMWTIKALYALFGNTEFKLGLEK